MCSWFANCLCVLFLSIIVNKSSTLFIVKKPAITPIILVPGDGGSQMEAKLNKETVVHYLCEKTTQDFFNIWLNMELLVPVIIDCWIDNMRLVYNNVTRTTSNSKGVETRIPGFGNTTSVEWLDPSEASPGAYFKDIAVTLTALGYERNISLRGAPYDFRKAPNENGEYFAKLKELVEETYTVNENQPVMLLAHSMGGPMTLHFLHGQSKSWKDKYIRAFLTLSGAWGGSVKALKVFAIGDDLGSYVLRESTLREEQITCPSLAWLMPSSLFWDSNDILVQTDQKNFTIKDFQAFFTGIDYSTGWEMYKDVEKYSLEFQPPGVEVHCLHGYGVNTINRLVYKPGDFPDGYPDFLYGDGDGTVNKQSLEACWSWQGKQKNKVYHQTFPDLDHMGILRDKRVLSYIEALIKKL